MLVLALDLAPTHSAAVLVAPTTVHGQPSAQIRAKWFSTDRKQLHTKHSAQAVLLPNLAARKKLTNLSARMTLCDGMRTLMNMIRRDLQGVDEVAVVIEGYAVGARGLQLETGEIGGVARQMIWNWPSPSWKAREYHPRRVAEFLGFSKVVKKPEKQVEALRRYPNLADSFDRCRTKAATGGDTFGDLVDAYVLGRMGLMELALRGGRVNLGDIAEGPERAVWLKTTNKQQPVNLLAMEWTERA